MITIDTTEKRFESDIEAFFLSPEGGYTKGTAPYSPGLGLFDSVLTDFVKETQPGRTEEAKQRIDLKEASNGSG